MAFDLADVEQVVKRILATVTSPIAAQKDGSTQSDGHRVLNFQGAGVTVSDDPATRRVNINIPGAPTTSTTSTFVSTAGSEKVYTLTSGDIAGAPANWQTTGFSDAAWSASVLMTVSIGSFYTPVSSTSWVSDVAGSVTVPAGCLVRRTMALPAGTIVSATLEINTDDTAGPEKGIYINGTYLGSSYVRGTATPIGPAVIPISPDLLVPGANNVLAVHVMDPNPGPGSSPHSVSYRVTVNYTAAGTDSRYIPKSQITAKGDVIAGASANTPATLGVGSDGQVLTSRSTATNGVDWETPATGGMADPTTTKGDLIVHGTSTTRLGVGTDTQVLTADSAQTLGVKWAAVGAATLTTASAFLSSSVSMPSANVFYDGPSLSLAAGTWLLVGQLFMGPNGNAGVTIKLWDGTTVYSGGAANLNQVAGTISLSAIVTLTGTTTLKISAAQTIGGGSILAPSSWNSPGNFFSYLNAVKVG